MMLAVLCTQHLWCLVAGLTLLMAGKNPSAPSPTATSGAMVSPRFFNSSNTPDPDRPLSRPPSDSSNSSFSPSLVTPIMIRIHWLSLSSRQIFG